MSTFKQKLKILLKDSSSSNLPLNDDQLLGKIMLKTLQKIRRSNSRQPIQLFTYKTKNNLYKKESKSSIDEYLQKNNIEKGISSKTALNMIQALSLLN